tara:strand:- start:4824 stop:8285 length:3462 start_codon:yes stop_codon:yes gene_type:complete
MAARSLVIILLTTLLAPMVHAEADNTLNLGFGATLSDNPEDAPLTYAFSPAVRAAFARTSDLSQYTIDQRESVEQWVVVSPFDIGTPTTELANSYIIDANFADGASNFAILQYEGKIEVAYPLVEKTVAKKWTPNDAKFGDQWHLQNTGQTGGNAGEDANLTAAWDDYRGNGVVIGIVDDGVDWTHADLDNYYEDTLDYDYCNNDGDPSPSYYDGHGTSAAGVAAAAGNNTIGVSGAAPKAGLAGLLLIACSTTDVRESNSLSHERQNIDIYSNSWGPSDNGRTVEAPGPLMLAAFENDVSQGRGGLGNIITWAAGNGLDDDDNSNYDGYANSRHTIAVTAVTHYGEQSWYAEPGANILVAAPSDGSGEGITTTDIEGGGGYNGGDYNDNFGGTSSATPLVSGVVALILEANPSVTYRDVEHIIVHSSRVNDAGDNSWNTNGAGHDVSHKYGFGVIDASAAVDLAETWVNVDPVINYQSGLIDVPDQQIPDNSAPGIVETIQVPDSIKIEHVEVVVDIDHTYRGDLEIILTSPSGTQSVLSEKHEDSGNNWNNWMFTSVHHWDEDSFGEWSLSIEDKGNGDTGTLRDWELNIYGTEINTDRDGDGLTNYDEVSVYGTDPDDIDTDDDQINDGEEVNIYNTNPLSVDSDSDGLEDGREILVNATDPLDVDTDDDGLLDGAEVDIHFTNPLVADPDADSDTFYWFQDCDDTNDQIYPGAQETLNFVDDDCDGLWDEGFNQTDSDADSLSDYAEFHIYGTDYNLQDTDGDMLEDGEEVLQYQSNPLVYDNDTDLDGFYWFQDCNDTNDQINPDAVELLDAIDNDCDELIDEDFVDLDRDNDQLPDLVEFYTMNTDPLDNDTDDDGLEDGFEILTVGSDPTMFDTDFDGLSDGVEVLETNTNPRIPDLDEDGDGFRWFEECDDTNSNINPNAPELWNGIDDNCNDLVDDGVNRFDYVAFTSLENTTINATEDKLSLSMTFDLTEEDFDNIGLELYWYRNSTLLSRNDTFEEGPFNCTITVFGFGGILCAGNGTIGPYSIKAVAVDDYGTVEYTWNVSYFVYHPPEPEEPDEQSTVSRIVDTLSDNFMTVLIGVLSALVILLLVIRLRQNKPTNIPVNPPPPQAFGQAMPQNRYEPKQSKYAEVKSAPDLSILDNKWK